MQEINNKYSRDRWITPKLSLEDHEDPLPYEDKSLTFNKEVKDDDKMTADELTNDPEELKELEEKYKDSAKEAEDNPSSDTSSDTSSSDDSSSSDDNSDSEPEEDPTSEDDSKDKEDKKDDDKEDKKEDDSKDTKEQESNDTNDGKDDASKDDSKEAVTEAFFDRILGLDPKESINHSLEEVDNSPPESNLNNQITNDTINNINKIQKLLVYRNSISNEEYNKIIKKINQLDIKNFNNISIEEYNHETRSILIDHLEKAKISIENNARLDGAVARLISWIVNKFRKGYPAYHKSCQLEGGAFIANHDLFDTKSEFFLDPREAVNKPGYLEKAAMNLQSRILANKHIEFIRLEKEIAKQVFNIPIEDKDTWDEIARVNNKARQIVQNKMLELEYKKRQMPGYNIADDWNYLNSQYQVLWSIYSIALFLPKGSKIAD